MRVIRAWDGSEAWVGTQAEELETVPMPEGEAIGFVLDARIDGSLVDWRDKGSKVALVGSTEVEGVAVVQLAVTLAGGGAEQCVWIERRTCR